MYSLQETHRKLTDLMTGNNNKSINNYFINKNIDRTCPFVKLVLVIIIDEFKYSSIHIYAKSISNYLIALDKKFGKFVNIFIVMKIKNDVSCKYIGGLIHW